MSSNLIYSRIISPLAAIAPPAIIARIVPKKPNPQIAITKSIRSKAMPDIITPASDVQNPTFRIVSSSPSLFALSAMIRPTIPNASDMIPENPPTTLRTPKISANVE